VIPPTTSSSARKPLPSQPPRTVRAIGRRVWPEATGTSSVHEQKEFAAMAGRICTWRKVWSPHANQSAGLGLPRRVRKRHPRPCQYRCRG
jgi:hypothetical protein